MRAEGVAGQAGPWLYIVSWDRGQSVDACGPPIAGSHDWARHEVTAQVSEDAELIRFGLTLTGPGQVALRKVELTRATVSDLARP